MTLNQLLAQLAGARSDGNEEEVTRLTTMIVDQVHLVDRGANRRMFAIRKGEDMDIIGDELAQNTDGDFEALDDVAKAVWSTAYVNELPDNSFLYIAPGGEKDEDGKTKPRSLRYFPVKDENGKVDLPHLRNAIARIPQSNAEGLTPDKKNALQDKARKMLEEASKTEKADVKMSLPAQAKSNALQHLSSAIEKLQSVMSRIKSASDGEGKMPMDLEKDAKAAMQNVTAAFNFQKPEDKMADDTKKEEQKAEGDETKKTEQQADTKAADTKPDEAKAAEQKTDDVQVKKAEDGSIDLGDGVVIPAGPLADLALETVEKAGAKISNSRLTKLRDAMKALTSLYKELESPEGVEKLMSELSGSIKKSIDASEATGTKLLEELQKLNAHFAAGEGKPGPSTIPDGKAGAGDPTKKADDKPQLIPAGVDMSDKRYHAGWQK